MKKYRAIFFDWDGTAVLTRTAPVEEAAEAMRKLLNKQIYLIVVSGTTYEKIGDGAIHRYFSKEQRKYLFFGLGRGSQNIGFDEAGNPIPVAQPKVGRERLLCIHDTAYQIHRTLLERWNYPTDIVFSRPNYCKIDLLCEAVRNENQYLNEGELTLVNDELTKHGIYFGLSGLIALAQEIGEKHGLSVKATCDAKFLEVGVLNKSDNVDALLTEVLFPRGVKAEDCCFWGDEYLELAQGLYGSDSFMRTELSKAGDFFDVSGIPGARPQGVVRLGGSVGAFLRFLHDQSGL